MDFEEVIINRSSIRSFKNIPIEELTVEKIIQAIVSAPSAGNLQSYKVYIVENKGILEDLVSATYEQEFISQANLAFIFCTNSADNENKFGKSQEYYSTQDATIAAAYCQLAVTNSGLASVWIGALEADKIQEIVGIPENEKPIAIIPVGYPNELPYPTGRKALDKVITRIR